MNPSDVLAATADAAASHDPLDDILRQIVGGYFVLPDGQGVQGTSVNDLDDAAAVVARLLSALERIDDLERMASSLPAQLDEARKEAEARAEAAERETAALRAELQRAVGGESSGPDVETLARLERLQRSKLDGERAADEQRRALALAEAARAELAERL